MRNVEYEGSPFFLIIYFFPCNTLRTQAFTTVPDVRIIPLSHSKSMMKYQMTLYFGTVFYLVIVHLIFLIALCLFSSNEMCFGASRKNPLHWEQVT